MTQKLIAQEWFNDCEDRETRLKTFHAIQAKKLNTIIQLIKQTEEASEIEKLIDEVPSLYEIAYDVLESLKWKTNFELGEEIEQRIFEQSGIRIDILDHEYHREYRDAKDAIEEMYQDTHERLY
ncbi:hypothetical protein [Pleurocapsa sp. FMAR1]|uniref:hypothetical protein n=1 Tax=Pleurocapsa sp. FMAR1 TaxID=3040204 RepID=UPI0029C76603|nr:hypothetical protein [Pleurocapsa sp. FMAR1]